MRFIYKIFSFNFWRISFLYFQALNYLKKHKFNQSIKKFKEILSIEIHHFHLEYSCYKYVGICHCYLNEIEKAKPFLERALSLKKNGQHDSELYAYLGFVFDNNTDPVRAKNFYELALKYFKSDDLTDIKMVESRLKKINEA